MGGDVVTLVEHFYFSVHVVAVSADSLQTNDGVGVVQTLTVPGGGQVILTLFLSQPHAVPVND